MANDILDAEEVAAMLRVHPRTIMRLANQGQIPGFKVGGQWRFRREAIDEYIRAQEHQHSEQKKEKSSALDDTDNSTSDGNDQDESEKS